MEKTKDFLGGPGKSREARTKWCRRKFEEFAVAGV